MGLRGKITKKEVRVEEAEEDKTRYTKVKKEEVKIKKSRKEKEEYTRTGNVNSDIFAE